MTDAEIVDARGLGCPQPVILARKALESRDRVLVVVDNEIALENVKRLGKSAGCDMAVDRREGGLYGILLSKRPGAKMPADDGALTTCDSEPVSAGPFVAVFSDNRMGRGSDELGDILMRAFLHTLCRQECRPDILIFYNAGVKLTVKDSAALEDLRLMAEAGAELLVCGTCTNYFGITAQVAVGAISNMYDIAEAMSRAGRLVRP